MTHTEKHLLRSLAMLTAVLGVVVLSDEATKTDTPVQAYLGQMHTAAPTPRHPDTPEYRIAVRLQKRLRAHQQSAPKLDALAEAVKTRQALLQVQTEVTFETEEGDAHDSWFVSTQKYPLWIRPNMSLTKASFELSPEAIAHTLQHEDVAPVQKPVDAVVTAVKLRAEDEKGVHRVEVDGVAKAGYTLEPLSSAEKLHTALSYGRDSVSLPMNKIHGSLVNESGYDLGDLALWSTGRSNFAGSTWGRSRNVHKALEEHVNNTLVAPGEEFSFNSTLDGPVTTGNGWTMAKIIVNGADLEMAPGGGICQASTTTYRAILNAGFPVVDRKAHSLYVSYYKAYGVGIDATIFPGSQDLSFVNDSDNYLLIQSYIDGYDAYVNIYGTPDGRTVELEGPYFAETAPAGFVYNGGPLQKNEIAWSHRVTYADGFTRNDVVGSRYRYIPYNTLVREYSTPTLTLHAAAPEKKNTDHLEVTATVR